MAVVKDIFRILKNGVWDEHHFRTSADQVIFTKEDGTASNVQKELAAQNSAMPVILYSGSLVAKSDGTSGFNSDFSKYKYLRVYGRCFDELFTYDIPLNNRMSSTRRFRGGIMLTEVEADEIYYSNSAVTQDLNRFIHLYTGYYKIPAMAKTERQNNQDYIITKVEGYLK